MKSLKQHITEAKINKMAAHAVLDVIQYSKPYQGAITMNKAMRDRAGVKLPDEIPSFAELMTLASGGKDKYELKDGSWVKNGKVIVKGGINRKDFKTLMVKSGVKI
jgi:hypothetical protein